MGTGSRTHLCRCLVPAQPPNHSDVPRGRGGVLLSYGVTAPMALGLGSGSISLHSHWAQLWGLMGAVGEKPTPKQLGARLWGMLGAELWEQGGGGCPLLLMDMPHLQVSVELGENQQLCSIKVSSGRAQRGGSWEGTLSCVLVLPRAEHPALALGLSPCFWVLSLYLSQCYIDGPYGTPTRRIFTSEHAVLIGAGIGITPFASILQSIMYRLGLCHVLRAAVPYC